MLEFYVIVSHFNRFGQICQLTAESVRCMSVVFRENIRTDCYGFEGKKHSGLFFHCTRNVLRP
jgi:hypothetical protein